MLDPLNGTDLTGDLWISLKEKDSGLFVPVDLQKKYGSDAIEGIIRELRSMSLDDAYSAFIVHLPAS